MWPLERLWRSKNGAGMRAAEVATRIVVGAMRIAAGVMRMRSAMRIVVGVMRLRTARIGTKIGVGVMKIGTMTKTEGAETTTPAQAVMRMQVAVTTIATPTWMAPATKVRKM